jgi:sulfopyruvate decarboxylase subunit beta
MRRYEALQEIMRVVTDEPVVITLGHPAQELFSLRDRPQNFYMLGSMGLCTSIGHGLALSQPKKVVVIDGDAAVTMNMGGFATIGHTRPRNLIQIVIDNAANGSTGFQPSFTAGRLKLEEVARAAGLEQIDVITEREQIAPSVTAALKGDRGPYFILIKTRVGMPEAIGVIPIGPIEIKDRFRKSILPK